MGWNSIKNKKPPKDEYLAIRRIANKDSPVIGVKFHSNHKDPELALFSKHGEFFIAEQWRELEFYDLKDLSF